MDGFNFSLKPSFFFSKLAVAIPIATAATLAACGGLEPPAEGGPAVTVGSGALIRETLPAAASTHFADLLNMSQTTVYSRSTGQPLHCVLTCSDSFCDEELRMAQEIFDLTNAERERAGLPRFGQSDCVTAVARSHSLNQARQRSSSDVLDGRDVSGRLLDADVASTYSDENVHYRWSTRNGQPAFDDAGYPATALAYWRSQPRYLNKILNPGFTVLGIGVVKSIEGDRGAYYTTQVFMSP